MNRIKNWWGRSMAQDIWKDMGPIGKWVLYPWLCPFAYACVAVIIVVGTPMWLLRCQTDKIDWTWLRKIKELFIK